jgi:hypothetical protein
MGICGKGQIDKVKMTEAKALYKRKGREKTFMDTERFGNEAKAKGEVYPNSLL